ncbi:DUF4296 domain-containing protein [Sphingobacterium bovistauri]|uniref:DUF4296 domain-containing protein n=1 Tax=Sphingobacterium bovistauri TaxID=2781959 RepID=A0ABS7Z434_9SPHI|nr:DUF4296 domain-containing protein [Sphingobacterium bovistauri]MCA5004935.1 DUF4296 domain-containing protein [Sphingobacterium bovistauri]
MQRLIYSIFISFFLILSCAKSKPNGVVSEDKISKVLTEVAIVDGYLNTLPSDSAKRVMPVLYGKIFKDFGLDSASFVKNLDYYFGDPNLTEKIYTVVGANLGIYDREFQIDDSIRMVKQNDSLNRVNYLQRLYSRIENLRYYNSSDTGYKNYYEYTRRVLNNTNLDLANNYFNLSPMPDLRMLDKDSIANFARNFKSPFVYIDTAMQKSIVIDQFKFNSERFLNKLRIIQPYNNIYSTPPQNINKAILLDRTVDSQDTILGRDTTSDSLPTVDSIQNVIQKPENRLRNNQMVKPVTRELPR